MNNTFITIKGLETMVQKLNEKAYNLFDKVGYAMYESSLYKRAGAISEVIGYLSDFKNLHGQNVSYCKGYVKIQDGKLDNKGNSSDLIMKYSQLVEYMNGVYEKENAEYEGLDVKDDNEYSYDHHDERMSNIAKELGVYR